jgi:hypothetical protein
VVLETGKMMLSRPINPVGVLGMRKQFSSSAAIILTLAPVFFAVVWHINNHGWPNDDAANYMETAYQQYRAFQDGSLLDGLDAVYHIRGWRPILFPVLATPFLWLFRGDVLAATGATLVLCFLVCQIYVYAIARRYLDPLRASFVAAFLGSCPAIAFQSTVFFAEMAWLAFFAGFVFHLLESEDFRKPLQATVAGILLACAALVRPAETLAIAVVPLISMIAMALARRAFLVKSAARIMGFVLLSACLLVASAFAKQVDYRVVLALGIIIAASQLLLMKADQEKEPGTAGLNLFAVSFMAINLLWWADSMPKLCSWIYLTSFGTMAQVTDVAVSRDGFFTILKQIFSQYLFPQGFLVALICLVLLLPNQSRDSSTLKRLGVLAMITLGLLLPMCIMYAATGTSDSRRVFVGMSFLLMLLSILSLQNGPLRRVRDIGIASIVAVQLAGFLWTARGESPPFGNSVFIRSGVQTPRQKADQNEALISRLLELGVPRNSKVAVYTMALFQARERIYEPAALQLAARTTGSNLTIVYYWDVGDYAAVIERLREDRTQFLLIDKYRDPENPSKHQPSMQFATVLIEKMVGTNADPQGLRRIATFKLGDREQVLFEVRSRIPGTHNLIR